MARNKKSKARTHLDREEDSEPTEMVAAAETDVHRSDADAASADDNPDSGSDEEAKAAAIKKQKRIDEMKAKREKHGNGKNENKKKGTAPTKATVEKDNNGVKSGENLVAEKEEDSEDDGEELEVTRQAAVEVLYCPICTFPAEMCEFSGMLEKCRPWLQEHAAELAAAEEHGRKRRILTEKERLEALIEGRGIKKALERVVVMEVEKRTGRRVITSVYGMDLFGFNLKDLSRDWRKAFACGVGIREAAEDVPQDCIDIQGNVETRLADMLMTKYKVPKDDIYIVRNKKKEKFF